MDSIKLSGFLDNSTVNGEGMRSVIFLSGCPHHCPGCHNQVMQNSSYGDLVSVSSIVNSVLKNLPIIDGVTISGGEPFSQPLALLTLSSMLKSYGINIWVYSGYTYNELISNEINIPILKNIDVLVDGKFIKELKSYEIKFRGSSNQRMIDVQKSLEAGEVVEIIA